MIPEPIGNGILRGLRHLSLVGTRRTIAERQGKVLTPKKLDAALLWG